MQRLINEEQNEISSVNVGILNKAAQELCMKGNNVSFIDCNLYFGIIGLFLFPSFRVTQVIIIPEGVYTHRDRLALSFGPLCSFPCVSLLLNIWNINFWEQRDGASFRCDGLMWAE